MLITWASAPHAELQPDVCVYVSLTISVLWASPSSSGLAVSSRSLARPWGNLQLSAAFSISSRLGLHWCGWFLALSSVFLLVEVPPSLPQWGPSQPSVCCSGYWSGIGRSFQVASVCSFLSAMAAVKWPGDATAQATSGCPHICQCLCLH